MGLLEAMREKKRGVAGQWVQMSATQGEQTLGTCSFMPVVNSTVLLHLQLLKRMHLVLRVLTTIKNKIKMQYKKTH